MTDVQNEYFDGALPISAPSPAISPANITRYDADPVGANPGKPRIRIGTE